MAPAELPAPMSWPASPADLVTYRWSPPHPRGAVLLAHGFGEYALRHAPLIAALYGAGYRVYAYDLRGHGRSAGRRAVVDVRQLVDDHLAARQALRAGLDRESLPLFAFGHSLGGLVTAASLLRDPRGVAGAVLSSPALLVGVREPAWLKAVGRVLGRVAPGLPVTALPTDNLSRDAAVVSAYRADAGVYQGKVPALTGVSMLAASEALWAGTWGDPGAWRLPTLLLHGDADLLADVEGSRRFFRSIASPDRTFHEVPGGVHELYHDTGRADALAWTLAWLDGHTAG